MIEGHFTFLFASLPRLLCHSVWMSEQTVREPWSSVWRVQGLLRRKWRGKLRWVTSSLWQCYKITYWPEHNLFHIIFFGPCNFNPHPPSPILSRNLEQLLGLCMHAINQIFWISSNSNVVKTVYLYLQFHLSQHLYNFWHSWLPHLINVAIIYLIFHSVMN